MKSKRTYKIIACVSIWLSVIIAAFSLALAKPKAGVIMSASYAQISERALNKTELNGVYISLDYAEFGSSKYMYYLCDPDTLGSSNAYFYLIFGGLRGDTNEPLIRISMGLTTKGRNAGLESFSATWIHCEKMNTNYSIYLGVSVLETLQKFSEASQTNADFLENNDFDLDRTTSSSNSFFKRANIIENCTNIYDLQQNDVALIYLSDISGLSSSAYRDEITINWGYIDSNDNTLYAVHAPTVSAQRTDNNIISLAMPINAAGDATSYYSIDQSAILSTISAGGATATAHIYGVYVWIQQARIQWGLAEFDTSGLPASGASMNYITSLTSLYDFTANNTSSMTCRLSISNNFNFITIKNQAILSAYNINTVIQQGGFLPAWAVYNWARGSSAGYTSGEQAGAAPYQPGGTGYQEIFEAGRQAGIAENIGTVNWFVSAFNAVDAMLNIRIFPNITIGYLVGIPFVISVVWFIIRMFRGGGSSS